MRDEGAKAGIGEEDSVLSVSDLTAQIRTTLEGSFAEVWVVGEVSNLKYHQSGHVYFSLKDDKAQLNCVIWRSTASRLRFRLEDGAEVFAFGGVTVYPPHGKYQLIVRKVTPKGIGALQLAFMQLLNKLREEGLFDDDRKKPLPEFPRKLAIVTSPTGAAIRDMLRILRARGAGLDVYVFPVKVQGEEAAPAIAKAIGRLNREMPELDVMIVGRGGGSIEDLWAFNEEVVARAIADSGIPVISGVGHEVDVTIADYAADMRAATPTEAAAMACPDRRELKQLTDHLRQRMGQLLQWRLKAARERLDDLASRPALRRPVSVIQQHVQRVDELTERLANSTRSALEMKRQRLEALSGKLNALSPRNVLERGYSITVLAESGKVVLNARQAPPGTAVSTLLHKGRLLSKVEKTVPDEESA